MAWQDLEKESTADLIEYIRWRDQPGYKETAEDAFIVFCLRFRDDVQIKCRIICGNRGYDDTIADEIAERTFERFLKYGKYNSAKCKSGNIDICVKLYLYKFSARLLSDYVKAETNPKPFTGEEELVTDFPDVEKMDIPSERKAIIKKKFEIVKNALDRLSPKHRIIYFTYKQYEGVINEGHYLHRNLLKKLQDELDLSQATIRKYKNEAFAKVEEYLNIYGAK
jgi:DNA-directed RNA polymerase specialized sigma24 family protein